MPVTLEVETVGTFQKRSDNSAVPGVLPNRLNEDPALFLKEPMDLKLGLESYVKHPYTDRFQSLCDWLKKNHEKGSNLREAIGADFVANRFLLKCILLNGIKTMPSVENVEIRAIRRNGVIFMCDKGEDGCDNYIVPKFARYMSLDNEGKPFDKNETVSTAETSKAVFRAAVSNGNELFKVFYGTEVDAVDKDGKFVALKARSNFGWMWLRYRSKILYATAILGSTEYALLGQVDLETKNVRRVDRVNIAEIPSMYPLYFNKENEICTWTPEVLFENLFNVLQQIKKRLPNDGDAIIMKLSLEGVSYEPEDVEQCTFLPDREFFEHFE